MSYTRNIRSFRAASFLRDASRHACEALEARRLLAQLIITGTNNADTITVDHSPFGVLPSTVFYTVNGVVTSVPASGVDSILIDAQSGSDAIDIEVCHVPLTLIGGAGNDVLRIANTTQQAGSVDGAIQFISGADNDKLEIHAEALAAYYEIASSNCRIGGLPGIAYGDTETVELFASYADVLSTRPGTNYNVVAGIVRAGANNFQSGISAGSVVNIVTGSLFLKDAVNSSPDDWVLESGRAYKRQAGGGPQVSGTVNFGASTDINLYTNDIGTLVEYNSTAQSSFITIQMGGGNDTLWLAKATADASSLVTTSGFDVYGDAGADTVVLFDSASADNDNTEMQWIGSEFSTYVWQPDACTIGLEDDIENFQIEGASGNNAFIVYSSAPGTLISVKGGGGNDEMHLAQNLANLDSVGTTSFDGQGGSNSLSIVDNGASINGNYTITDHSVARSGWGGVSYANVVGLVLEADALNSTFNFNSAAQNVRYELYGNQGDDTLNIGNDLDSNFPAETIGGRVVQFYGQAGFDAVNINDSADTTADGAAGNADYLDAHYDVARKYAAVGGTATSTEIRFAEYEYITYTGAAHRTVMSLRSALQATTVNAGGGDDEVLLGNGDLVTDIIEKTEVYGDGGNDLLVLLDLGVSTAPTYRFTATTFTRPGAAIVSFGTTETVRLEATQGDDVIEINGIAYIAEIGGNGGDDDLWLASATGNVSDLGGGQVTFNGGPGFDEAAFDDDNNSELATYTVNSTSVQRSSGVTLLNLNLEHITAFATHGANAFNVNGIAQNVRYDFYANGGDDTINVGNDLDSNFPAETIGGRIVQFYGQAGIDAVNINDSADTNADGASSGADYLDSHYDVLRKYAGRSGVATSTEIRFSEHEFITYTGANHPTALDLHQAWIPTTVNGGGGDDTVFIGDGNLVGNVTVAPVINGDAGSDLLWIQDDGTSTSAAYGLSASVFTRSSAANINFGTMENMLLICSNGASDIQINGIGYVTDIYGNGGADIFNLNSKLNVSTSLKGGDGDDTFYLGSTSNHDLDLLVGATSVSGDVGNDRLVLRDSGSFDPDTYTITATTMSRTGSGLVTYSSISNFQLESSLGSTPINVNATASGTQYLIGGASGNDTLTLGTGDVSALLGLVSYDGSEGEDTVELDNHLKVGVDAGAPFTVNGTIVTFGGAFGGLLYATTETLRIRGSNASNSYSIESLLASTTLDLITGGGDSVITLGNNDLSAIDGPVQITNNGALKTAVFNDTGGGFNGTTYTIADASFTRAGMGLVTWNSSMSRIRLLAGNGDNTIVLNTTNANSRYELNGQGGVDTFLINSTTALTTPTNSTGAAIIDGGTGLDIVNVNADGSGVAAAVFESTQDLATLQIGGGGILRLATSNGQANLRTNTLSIAPSGSLVLNDNAMVIDYTGSSPIATIEGYIRDGRLNKGLNSAGLSVASANIGSAESSALFATFPGSFAGTSVDSTSVLLRYTIKGDLNLDRAVNFDDLLKLSQNYGLFGKNYSQGNVDYSADGSVNFDDLLTIAQRYGTSLFSASPIASGAKDRRGWLAELT